MKKLFLLSVLFIFMGNVSAEKPKLIGDYIISGEKYRVICIAEKAFIQFNGQLTQVMGISIQNNGYVVRQIPMSCKTFIKTNK